MVSHNIAIRRPLVLNIMRSHEKYARKVYAILYHDKARMVFVYNNENAVNSQPLTPEVLV